MDRGAGTVDLDFGDRLELVSQAVSRICSLVLRAGRQVCGFDNLAVCLLITISAISPLQQAECGELPKRSRHEQFVSAGFRGAELAMRLKFFR